MACGICGRTAGINGSGRGNDTNYLAHRSNGHEPDRRSGVNLIYFLPIAALSVFIHRKNGLIDLKAMLPAIIAGTVGACLGAYGARLIDTGLLGKIFSVFVIFIGIKELLGAAKNK